jgi:hypothetical protein
VNTIAMDVNGCGIEHEASTDEEYGVEVMCAGWNPQLTLASESPVAQTNRHINLLADLAGVDVDAFLKKMYECQG